jgi:hypothetical protein
MSAKEKAQELFDKYCLAIKTDETDSGYFTNVLYAKQCALIAVDEIIEAIKIADNITFMYVIDYYKEVKQEIEKL